MRAVLPPTHQSPQSTSPDVDFIMMRPGNFYVLWISIGPIQGMTSLTGLLHLILIIAIERRKGSETTNLTSKSLPIHGQHSCIVTANTTLTTRRKGCSKVLGSSGWVLVSPFKGLYSPIGTDFQTYFYIPQLCWGDTT
jgi:hypothetical protein